MELNNSTQIDIEQEIILNADIKKIVSVLFDGRQFLIKLPSEITKFYDIKKGDKIILNVKPTAKGKGINSFEVMKNGKI